MYVCVNRSSNSPDGPIASATVGIFSRNQPNPEAVAEISRQLDTRRAQARPYRTLRPITASAVAVTKSDHKSTESRSYTEWQNVAWAHYERIGEVHFGFNLVANVFSRIRMYAASVVDYDQVPTPLSEVEEDKIDGDLSRRADAIMSALVGESMASAIMRPFALNFAVPGECYLTHIPEEGWSIKSTSEITMTDRGFKYATTRGSGGNTSSNAKNLPMSTYVARIWRQHPRWSKEPDSSMVGVADACEELLMLSRLVRSTARSRLNAGVLFIPDGLQVASSTEIGPNDVLDGDDAMPSQGTEFVDQLIESMVTPISDESSVASVVPMVVTGPTEYADKIKHITLDRASDEWLVSRADRALDRILQGIDLPKDIVAGLSNVKYMNAIVIDESLYKAHIEPMAIVLADALTDVYLRPLLKQAGFSEEDVNRIAVWYDPTEVVVRPNRSQDATTGVDHFYLSPSVWRREHGFSDTDAPTEEELASMLVTAKGQLPPDITAALFQQLLPEILGAKRDENVSNQVVEFPSSARDMLEGQAQQ